MSECWHILDRAMIHFFASFGVYLLGYFALRFMWRRFDWWKKWIGPVHRGRVAIAIFCLVWLGLWEGANVISGQSKLKLYTDYASWLIGLGVSVWGFWRYWNSVQEDL